jgi:zinc transporter 9
VGAEVDRLETEIQSLNPGIRFVDLETDRGRRAPGPSSPEEGDFDPGPVSEPFDSANMNEHHMSEHHMAEPPTTEGFGEEEKGPRQAADGGGSCGSCPESSQGRPGSSGKKDSGIHIL